jgi:hypothetical protein
MLGFVKTGNRSLTPFPDFAFEINRAFPNRRADGTSIHSGIRPLLQRERIGSIENEAERTWRCG